MTHWVSINGRVYRVVEEEAYYNMAKSDDERIAVMYKTGEIIPVANKRGDIGFYDDPKEIIHDINRDYQILSDLQLDVDDYDIKESIRKHEANRDPMEGLLSTDPDNIYKPPISGNETPEMLLLKKAIIAKGIDINKYENRFAGKQNDKRLLNKDSISMNKLKSIAESLDLSVTITISDKDDSCLNPMGEELTDTITD